MIALNTWSSIHDSSLEFEDANEEIQQNDPREIQNRYRLRDRTIIKAPDRYSACLVSYNEPKTYLEAMLNKDSNKWKDAIAEKLKAHEINKTWKISSFPANKNVIEYKWVFKIKENPSTNKIRYKARLCVKDYSKKKRLWL